MKKGRLHLYVYRSGVGLMARITSPAEFERIMKSPGSRTHVWAGRENFPFDLVVVHQTGELTAEQADYLCETQISFWPAFQNGLALEWSKGGIGGA